MRGYPYVGDVKNRPPYHADSVDRSVRLYSKSVKKILKVSALL